MKITFLGAAHEVTGSCTLLECGENRFLVDCGMEQGQDIFVNQELPVAPGDVDFVLLTHAHVDHSGNLPLLYKQGFDGLIYATKETCNLCQIMLRDCAHIQESEAEWQTRKSKRAGAPAVEPVYTMDDAEAAIAHLRPMEYGTETQIAEGVTVRFNDAAHLLGSANIEIWLTEGDISRKIVFSGDVGNYDQPIIRNVPERVAKADYVVCESTYGDRLHDRSVPSVKALAEYIQKTLDRGGNVVIPSFAVGRTQEMLYFIREIKEKGMVKGHDRFPVYVDSPLANEATAIYQQCDRDCLDADALAILQRGENPIWFDDIRFSVSSEDSKAINADPEPKVILSASGMCEAGRIRHHLKHNLWRGECTVLFVGYQAVGTLGRKLYDGADSVKIFNEEIRVNCEIGFLAGKSGHADQQGLIDWLNGFEEKPKLVFVNHGENQVTDSFAGLLETEHGFAAFAPYSGTVFDLGEEKFLECPDGIRIAKKSTGGAAASNLYGKLKATGEKLAQLIAASRGKSNKTLQKFISDLETIIKKYQ